MGKYGNCGYVDNYQKGCEIMAGARQPLELILANGRKHLTKKEIEERQTKEVKAKSDKVKPPSYLPKELKKEFTNISKELMDIGIMTNLDCDVLARYCIVKYQWEQITEAMLGMDIINQFGEYEAMSKMAERLFKQVRSVANDLGLSISSRCKLVMPKKKEEDKPISKEEKRFGSKL